MKQLDISSVFLDNVLYFQVSAQSNKSVTDGIDNFNQNVGNVLEVIDIDSAFNLIPGKTYIFTCTAWNIYGESGLSNEVVYGTPAIYTPPPTVIPIHVDKPTTITIDIIVN